MPQGLLYLDDAPPATRQAELTCQEDFRALWAREGGRFAARRVLEQQLAQALPAQAETRLLAFCAVCGAYRALIYDHNYSPDWLEQHSFATHFRNGQPARFLHTSSLKGSA